MFWGLSFLEKGKESSVYMSLSEAADVVPREGENQQKWACHRRVLTMPKDLQSAILRAKERYIPPRALRDHLKRQLHFSSMLRPHYLTSAAAPCISPARKLHLPVVDADINRHTRCIPDSGLAEYAFALLCPSDKPLSRLGRDSADREGKATRIPNPARIGSTIPQVEGRGY